MMVFRHKNFPVVSDREKAPEFVLVQILALAGGASTRSFDVAGTASRLEWRAAAKSRINYI
jgi:hypothetical protein